MVNDTEFKSKVLGLVGNERINGINPKLMKDIIENRHLLNEYDKWEALEKFRNAIGDRNYSNLIHSDLFDGLSKEYYILDNIDAFCFYIPINNPHNRLYVQSLIDGFALHYDNISHYGDVLDALQWFNNYSNINNIDVNFPPNMEYIADPSHLKIYPRLPTYSISKENVYKIIRFCSNHFDFENITKEDFIDYYPVYYYAIDPYVEFADSKCKPIEVKDLIKEINLNETQDVEKTPFNILEERICSYIRMILFFNKLDCEYSITLRNIVKAIKNELEIISNSDIIINYVSPNTTGQNMKHELIPTTEYGEKILNKVSMEWEQDILNDLLILNEEIKEKKKAEEESKVRKPISGRVRQNVLMRDNYTCQICGATVKDGAKLEIDHIVPFSKGGTNHENNLQVLCRQCNREKHNRDDLLHDQLKLQELKGEAK